MQSESLIRSVRSSRIAAIILTAIICITPAISFGQKSIDRGGGTTPIPTPMPVKPLPQTPPAPGVLHRESFGFAELFRPTSGNGVVKDVFAHQNIRNFWIEYPGNKNTQWIAPDTGKLPVIGLTNSGALSRNLETAGSIVLVKRPAAPYMNFTLLYELPAGDMTGTLLASGETFFEGYDQLKLRIDPVAKSVGGSVNDTDLGIHSLDISAPRYVGFEGVGIGDNFATRTAE